MTYIERAIDYTFVLGTGNFGEGGSNTVKVSGLRSTATITATGGPSMSKLNARIYGLTPTIMNTLSAMGTTDTQIRNNQVFVEAGDADSGMSLIFGGIFHDCYQDLNAAPNTFLEIIGWTGPLTAASPVQPFSVKGSGDVATIMSEIATKAGASLQNNGVNIKISNPYFPGTGLTQAQKLADAANINFSVLPNGVWSISPRNGAQSGSIPLISPNTGLVGYPKYSSLGVEVRTIFNPFIYTNQQFEIQSGFAQGLPGSGVNGFWVASKISHTLAAQMPGGPWFTDIIAITTGANGRTTSPTTVPSSPSVVPGLGAAEPPT
jgi:hypothetical protein